MRLGATSSGLAEAITGDGNDWRKLNFPRRPETLRAGEVIDIGPLLSERTRREVLVAPPAPAPQPVPAPAPPPGPTPEMIARARDKHWQITGNKAKALRGANLESLAWVITGNARESRSPVRNVWRLPPSTNTALPRRSLRSARSSRKERTNES